MGSQYSVGPFPLDTFRFVNVVPEVVQGKLARFQRLARTEFNNDASFLSLHHFRDMFDYPDDDEAFRVFSRFAQEDPHRVSALDFFGAMTLASKDSEENKIGFLFFLLDTNRDKYVNYAELLLGAHCFTRGFARLKNLQEIPRSVLVEVVDGCFSVDGVQLNENGEINLADSLVFLRSDDRCRMYFQNLTTAVASDNATGLFDQRETLLRELAEIDTRLHAISSETAHKKKIEARIDEQMGDSSLLLVTETDVREEEQANALRDVGDELDGGSRTLSSAGHPQAKHALDAASSHSVSHHDEMSQMLARSQSLQDDDSAMSGRKSRTGKRRKKPPAPRRRRRKGKNQSAHGPKGPTTAGDAEAFLVGCKPPAASGGGHGDASLVELQLAHHWKHLPQGDDHMVELDVDMFLDLFEAVGIILTEEDALNALRVMKKNVVGTYTLQAVIDWHRDQNKHGDQVEDANPVWRSFVKGAQTLAKAVPAYFKHVAAKMQTRHRAVRETDRADAHLAQLRAERAKAAQNGNASGACTTDGVKIEDARPPERSMWVAMRDASHMAHLTLSGTVGGFKPEKDGEASLEFEILGGASGKGRLEGVFSSESIVESEGHEPDLVAVDLLQEFGGGAMDNSASDSLYTDGTDPAAATGASGSADAPRDLPSMDSIGDTSLITDEHSGAAGVSNYTGRTPSFPRLRTVGWLALRAKPDADYESLLRLAETYRRTLETIPCDQRAFLYSTVIVEVWPKPEDAEHIAEMHTNQTPPDGAVRGGGSADGGEARVRSAESGAAPSGTPPSSSDAKGEGEGIAEGDNRGLMHDYFIVILLLHDKDMLREYEKTIPANIFVTRAIQYVNIQVDVNMTTLQAFQQSSRYLDLSERVYGPQEEEIGEARMNPIVFAKFCRDRRNAALRAADTAESMKLDELKQHLRVRGLDDSGSAPDLIARVVDTYQRQARRIGFGELSGFGETVATEIFDAFDKDKDGALSLPEMNAFLRSLGQPALLDEKEYLETCSESGLARNDKGWLTREGLVAYYDWHGELTADAARVGIGSLSTQLKAAMTMTCMFDRGGLESLGTMLESSPMAQRSSKLLWLLTAFAHDVYLDYSIDTLADLFEPDTAPSFLHAPGWLAHTVHRFREWLADGDKGILPAFRSVIAENFGDRWKSFPPKYFRDDMTAAAVAARSGATVQQPQSEGRAGADSNGAGGPGGKAATQKSQEDDAGVGGGGGGGGGGQVPDTKWDEILRMPPCVFTYALDSTMAQLLDQIKSVENMLSRKLNKKDRTALSARQANYKKLQASLRERALQALLIGTVHAVRSYDGTRELVDEVQSVGWGTGEFCVRCRMQGCQIEMLFPPGNGEKATMRELRDAKHERATEQKRKTVEALKRERFNREATQEERDRLRRRRLVQKQRERDRQEAELFHVAWAAWEQFMRKKHHQGKPGKKQIRTLESLFQRHFVLRENRYPGHRRTLVSTNNYAVASMEIYHDNAVKLNSVLVTMRKAATGICHLLGMISTVTFDQFLGLLVHRQRHGAAHSRRSRAGGSRSSRGSSRRNRTGTSDAEDENVDEDDEHAVRYIAREDPPPRENVVELEPERRLGYIIVFINYFVALRRVNATRELASQSFVEMMRLCRCLLGTDNPEIPVGLAVRETETSTAASGSPPIGSRGPSPAPPAHPDMVGGASQHQGPETLEATLGFPPLEEELDIDQDVEMCGAIVMRAAAVREVIPDLLKHVAVYDPEEIEIEQEVEEEEEEEDYTSDESDEPRRRKGPLHNEEEDLALLELLDPKKANRVKLSLERREKARARRAEMTERRDMYMQVINGEMDMYGFKTDTSALEKSMMQRTAAADRKNSVAVNRRRSNAAITAAAADEQQTAVSEAGTNPIAPHEPAK